VFDLGVPSSKAAIFNTIDHGPLPGEAIESSVYLSNDRQAWIPSVVQRVWLEGLHSNLGILWDGFVFAVGTATGEDFRYVSVIHGGPGALLNDGDDEINGVLGLDENFQPTTLPTLALSAQAPAAEFAVGTQVIVSGLAHIIRASEAVANASIEYVLLNGSTVDVLDVSGQFFTSVLIQPGGNRLEFEAFSSDGRSVSVRLNLIGRQLGPDAIDFSRFADITGSFSGVYGRTSFNEEAKLLHVNLATRNDGAFEADVPLLVGVKNISDPTVSVVGADGVTPDGIPFYDYTDLVPGGRLDPGELTASPTVSFHNPNRIQFDYELIFLGKLNEPPIITSVPGVEAYFDRTYNYDVEATDSDNDPLTFSLTAAPAAMTIDATSGLIQW